MSFKLIIGPMFAGKSTFLLDEINKIISSGQEVLVICHSSDDRYGLGLNTHNGNSYKDVILGNTFKELITKHNLKIHTYRNIIIDELQFFPDAYNFITWVVDVLKTNVIAGGLNGDFERKPIGDITSLIPFADNIITLSAKCKICNRKASFSRRMCDSKERILPGGADKYIPTCRECYLKSTDFLIKEIQSQSIDHILTSI